MSPRHLRSPFDWIARLVVGGLVCVCVGGLVVSLVTERHARRAAEAQVCAAELKAWRASSPLAARLQLVPSDPCLAIRVVAR